MDHGNYKTEVELESLRETGVGGLQRLKPLKGLRSVPVIVNRGEEDYLGRRGITRSGVTSIVITPLKWLRSVPKLHKNVQSMLAWYPL